MGKDRTETNKDQLNIKKDIFIPVAVALIVAIGTSFTQQHIWMRQHRIEEQDKVYERKIHLLDEISESIFEYEVLLQYKIQYDVAYNDFARTYNKLEMKESGEIDEQIKKYKPYIYEKNLEYKEYVSKLQSKFSIAKVYFGDQTENAINKFDREVVQIGYNEYIKIYIDYLKQNNIPQNNLTEDEIIYNSYDLTESIKTLVNGHRYDILKLMHNEIKSKF